MNVTEELKIEVRIIEVMVKTQKSRRGSGGGVGWDGQGGCEQRIDVIVKMQKKSRRGSGWGGQGGCEHRIEVIVKMKKSRGGG